MNSRTPLRRAAVLLLVLGLGNRVAVTAEPVDHGQEPLTMIVMDPLSKPLSCPCVQGYAQRDYHQLAKALSQKLGRPVKTHFKESLTSAMEADTAGKAHLVIGKHSVVIYDAKHANLQVTPLAKLTDKQGNTTMTGLFVVATGDPAEKLAEITGYRLVFGPEECDEKHAAALKTLAHHKIAVPDQLETSPACDEGAIWILEDAALGKHGAAVISSYAKPLLEGCGTVEKGSLRVIGETEPVPFIEAFATDQLTSEEQGLLKQALIDITEDPELRIALETQQGFVPMGHQQPTAKKKS